MTTARPGPALSDVVDSTPGDEIERMSPLLEVGKTGLKRVSGYVVDEFLPQLRGGRKAIALYREMSDNSAVISAWFYTIMQLLRQIEWRVEPASNSAEDRANAEFVEQNMHDMEQSWGDFVGEACTMLIYGWSVHEMVFKRRQGLWAKDARNISAFDDNKIGWRKFPIRAQESLLRWKFADNGDVLAMIQMPAPGYERRVIGMDRCLHFRTRVNKNNPEGWSLLRPMYRSWFMLKRFEEIEAIGIERDLTGLPVALVPQKYLNPMPGSAEEKMLSAIRAAVTAVRRNEQEGLIWPLEYEGDTKNLVYDFKLLTSGGTRQFNIDEVITRYETRMLMSAMADFIMTGHEDSGASYALHTDKSGIFETGVNAVALAIAEPVNRNAIRQLFRLNAMRPDKLPTIVPNNVNPPDLGQLGQFMTAATAAGMQLFPDPELDKFLRDAARLPQLDEDTEKAEEQQQRMAAVIATATQQLQLVQIEQQAKQGELGLAQQEMGVAAQQQQLASGPEQAPGDPGDPDGTQAKAQAGHATAQAGEKTNQAKLGTAQQQARLAQEKQKLANLKRPPAKAAAKDKSAPPRKPVRKSMSAFGVDHSQVEC